MFRGYTFGVKVGCGVAGALGWVVWAGSWYQGSLGSKG